MLVLDFFPVADFALVYPEGKAAIGVDADPSLEKDGSSLLAVVGKRDQHPGLAFLACRELHLHLLESKDDASGSSSPLTKTLYLNPGFKSSQNCKHAPSECPRQESNLDYRFRRPV
jgi:hypothetical protein